MMNANIDEEEWVIHMTSVLNNGDEIDVKNPVCIFQVPKSIRDTKPEAYTPQVVALGPYHHFQPKTYHMQKCKISAALKAREWLKLRKVPEMMNEIKEISGDVGASYHDNLGIKPETLSWIMLIDGLFLLSLIHKPKDNPQVEETDRSEDLSGGQHSSEANLEDDVFLENQIPPVEVEVFSICKNDLSEETNYQEEKSTDQFEDSRGRKHSLDTILKDVVLLENQIPKIALEALSMKETEDNLRIAYDMKTALVDFCAGLSPIELKGNTIHHLMEDPHHVLDALHQLVWLGKRIYTPSQEANSASIQDWEVSVWTNLYNQLSKLNFGIVSMILVMVDLILMVLNVLGLSIPRDIFSEKEVLIPSASQLSGVGVKFYPPRIGGIKHIYFDPGINEVFFSNLPVLKANINNNLSEVVMRNLLAYEAEAMPESPKFSRYIELMSGLMQTVTDVELLKKANIVPQDTDSAEVVKLFGSLKEVVGSKGKSYLDETIEKVNAYYDNCRKVKIRRLAKRYLFVSWKVLTGFALIMVMALLVLQTFCSVYSCPKIFKV